MLLAHSGEPVITITIYRCAGCGATWRILPRFLARHLWRTWQTVETVAISGSPPPPSQPAVPERTMRRWGERLRSSARGLVQLLATSGVGLFDAIIQAVGLDSSRAELIAGFGVSRLEALQGGISNLASLIHRLGPGIRLV